MNYLNDSSNQFDKTYEELIRMKRSEVVEYIDLGVLEVDYSQEDLTDGHIVHPTNHELVYVEYPKLQRGEGDRIEDFYNYDAVPQIYIDGFRYLQ